MVERQQRYVIDDIESYVSEFYKFHEFVLFLIET